MSKSKFNWSKAKPNPYVRGQKKQISIRLDAELIQWLVAEAERKGIRGYQTFVNQILQEYAQSSTLKSNSQSLPSLIDNIFLRIKSELIYSAGEIGVSSPPATLTTQSEVNSLDATAVVASVSSDSNIINFSDYQRTRQG